MFDSLAISEIIRDVAAEHILPLFQNLQDHEIEQKSPGDNVTIADKNAENALISRLKGLYPNAVIAGEEIIAKDPKMLTDVMKAAFAFLIDPIDGTNNFIRGSELFAVMLVALHKSVPVGSWIYLPAQNILAQAEQGSGCWINGQKNTMPAAPSLQSELIGAAHTNRFPDPLKQHVRQKLEGFKENKPAFCAGYDYIALVRGQKHFSLYYRTLPWDHLPGALMVCEAGGYVQLLNGENYTIHTKDTGLLSAANEDDWNRIYQALFK